MTEYQSNSLQKLVESIQQGKWDNDGLVQLIELCGSYLNLQTISDYAKQNKISYNGAKKFRNVKKIFNVNFIIDNE